MSNKAAARVVGVILVFVVAVACVWAFSLTGLPMPVPGYALKSATVLRAEMALALVIAATIPLIFIGRLLTGVFPSRISPQGLEWQENGPDLLKTISELRNNIQALESADSFILEVIQAQEERLNRAGI